MNYIKEINITDFSYGKDFATITRNDYTENVVFISDDFEPLEPSHDKLYLFGHEHGCTHVIASHNEQEAYEQFIDTITICTEEEVKEALEEEKEDSDIFNENYTYNSNCELVRLSHYFWMSIIDVADFKIKTSLSKEEEKISQKEFENICKDCGVHPSIAMGYFVVKLARDTNSPHNIKHAIQTVL